MKEFGREQGSARFSEGDREELVKRGFVIYRIGEQSVGSIRAGNRHLFTSFYQESYPDFEKQTSIRSEVAAHVGDFYLTGSNWKSLAEQNLLVENLSSDLQLDGLAVRAIIGEVSDYIEYATGYFEQSGQKLNGNESEDCYIRTLSCLENGKYVHLKNLDGFPQAVLGYDWDVGYGHKDVYVAPLVVPING